MKELTPDLTAEQKKKLSYNPEQAFQKELEVDVLARTLWGEARGEGSAGMQAVANVIVNRLRISENHHKPYWWGNTLIEICQKPFQFSCWNEGDPNLDQLLAVDETNIHFMTAKRIARRAVYTQLDDMAEKATHYHAAGIMPFWAHKKQPVTVIGRHIFYRLVSDDGKEI